MKINDIKVGETYAKGKWGSKVTVEGIHQGGMLPEGYKYYGGYSWQGATSCHKKMVLVIDEHGTKECVTPQELKMQWNAYQTKEKADQKAREERYRLEKEQTEARKVEWLKLAPVLEAAGIDAWNGLEYGSIEIKVTAEQINALLKGVK